MHSVGGGSPKVPKSNFNGNRDLPSRSEFHSPKLTIKGYPYQKSPSLHEEVKDNNVLTMESDEQQTALMLPHLMSSKSTPHPITTSLPTSSTDSSSQPNSYRSNSNPKHKIETGDIYEDPSEHYSIIGRPSMVTSFQTSTPVRNTVSRVNQSNFGKNDSNKIGTNVFATPSLLQSQNKREISSQNQNYGVRYGMQNQLFVLI